MSQLPRPHQAPLLAHRAGNGSEAEPPGTGHIANHSPVHGYLILAGCQQQLTSQLPRPCQAPLQAHCAGNGSEAEPPGTGHIANHSPVLCLGNSSDRHVWGLSVPPRAALALFQTFECGSATLVLRGPRPCGGAGNTMPTIYAYHCRRGGYPV